ncbi:MAG: hypothetical protein KIC98_04700 [Clostridioides difficile]|nr:hypothetical protein [Clostridioides difficile]
MKIIKINEEFYCITDEKFSYEKFNELFHNDIPMRKNSFAFKYTIKILKELFKYSLDLKQDYLKYYYQEYDDFKKYLYHKELLESDIIKNLNIEEWETLLKLRVGLSNYNTTTLLEYEDGIVDTLNQFLEGIDNEAKE